MKKLLFLAALGLASLACAAGDDDSFVFATYNVMYKAGIASNHPRHYTKRMPAIATLVKNSGFDVFGAQEPDEDELPLLMQNLGSGYSCVGYGREEDHTGEGVPIIFRNTRFACLKWGTFWLSTEANQNVAGSKYPGAQRPRICTWARLKDKTTGKCFRYFNTHLESEDEDARYFGMQLIVSKVNAAIARGETVFVSGDLNDTLQTLTQKQREDLVSERGPVLTTDPAKSPLRLLGTALTDTLALSESDHTGPVNTFHSWKGPDAFCTLDYIFTTNSVRVLSHATLDDATLNDGGDLKPPSDHYPVKIVVSLANCTDEGMADDDEEEGGEVTPGGGGEQGGGEGGGEVTPGDASVACRAAPLTSDEGSVLTNGTLAYAYCYAGNGSGYTAHGVLFADSQKLQGIADIAVSPTLDDGRTGWNDEGVSGEYGKILKKGWLSKTSGPQTWTFKNLTAGHAYQVQFLIHNSESGKSADYTVTGPDGASTVAYCGTGWTYGGTIIVSFTAKGATQNVVLAYSGAADTSKCVNAVQVRDLGAQGGTVYGTPTIGSVTPSVNGTTATLTLANVDVGENGGSYQVWLAYAEDGEPLGEAAVALGSQQSASCAVEIPNLTAGKKYRYSLFVKNAGGKSSEVKSGFFTCPAADDEGGGEGDPERPPVTSGWTATPMDAAGDAFSREGTLVFSFMRDRSDEHQTTRKEMVPGLFFNWIYLPTDTITQNHVGGASMNGVYDDGRDPADFFGMSPAFNGATDKCGNAGLTDGNDGFAGMMMRAWSGSTLDDSGDGAGKATLTLRGLTAGNRYLLQVFVHEDSPNKVKGLVAPDGVTTAYYGNREGVSGDWSCGGVLTCVFTAAATDQSYELVYLDRGSYQMNAIQLRDLGAAPAVELVAPEFADGGAAFAVTSEAMSLTVGNPVKGAWYTVFTSEALTGPYTSESASLQFTGEGTTLALSAAVEADKPCKFAKVVVSLEPFAAGEVCP